MKENAGFLTSWLKKIFLIHAHISYQPIKTSVWQYITNQNSCDITAVFPYSHLNTANDQWECAYYPNYFIKEILHGLPGNSFQKGCQGQINALVKLYIFSVPDTMKNCVLIPERGE